VIKPGHVLVKLEHAIATDWPIVRILCPIGDRGDPGKQALNGTRKFFRNDKGTDKAALAQPVLVP
jgi:hypothetical protein